MKTRGDFHFKKFSVSHHLSTHKVGTDGVLLGAWVDVTGAKRILDIGTGTGVVALMLAQRTSEDVLIDAVELQEQDALEATQNVLRSPWANRITIHNIAVQDYRVNHQYDLIVSNPPFFVNSWLPPDEKRGTARHTNHLSFTELLDSLKELLSPTGTFAVVLPFTEGKTFEALAQKKNLGVKRELLFRTRANKSPERLLMAFSYGNAQRLSEDLVLYERDEEWSGGYRVLMRDFYLKA